MSGDAITMGELTTRIDECEHAIDRLKEIIDSPDLLPPRELVDEVIEVAVDSSLDYRARWKRMYELINAPRPNDRINAIRWLLEARGTLKKHLAVKVDTEVMQRRQEKALQKHRIVQDLNGHGPLYKFITQEAGWTLTPPLSQLPGRS